MNNKIVIITATILMMMVGVTTSASYATNKQDTAWNDGVRDCALGYSYWIDQHSNAGHHSAQYMNIYNQAFNSCNGPTAVQIQETTSHSQAQSANPQVTCSVLIGTCNTGQKTNQAQEDNSSNE